MVDMSLDILAIAAHPDDAELGCGGSLLLAAKERRLSVAIADLSAGEMSSRGTVASRQIEADNAARILGLKERRNLGLARFEDRRGSQSFTIRAHSAYS